MTDGVEGGPWTLDDVDTRGRGGRRGRGTAGREGALRSAACSCEAERRTNTDEHGRTRTNTDEHGRTRTNTDEHGRNRAKTAAHGDTRPNNTAHAGARTH